MDFRAENELAMVEHARDRLINRIAKPPPLRGDVNERNRGIVQPDLLIHRKPTLARSARQQARTALG